MIAKDIFNGVEAELEDTPEFFDFKVVKSIPDGSIWKVFVDLENFKSEGLDESLEEARAWWAGPPRGTADVLSVIPEKELLNLRFATAKPPEEGQLIRIYPPRYLEALRDCWRQNHWMERCVAWLNQVQEHNTFDKSCTPDPRIFAWLRDKQREAFRLLGWQMSFLWGPPGTGKTTTLGAMLARYLIAFPSHKVLLLSTTNTAVDQALVAVDKRLAELEAASVRARCFRIGNHFIASNYEGREHLLPVKDPKLVRQLAELEARRPDPEDVQAYAVWKAAVEKIRREMRRQAAQVLDSAQLAAMTTTLAVFAFEDLRDRMPYDLIVFDEASQVGIAHALALAPLARRCLFAGDPKQLAPIVQSDHPDAVTWLGRSMFAYMRESAGSTCLLDEQSRMAEPICKIVSNVFYGGKLKVARDATRNKKWLDERTVFPIRPVGDRNVHLEFFDDEGQWSARYHGPIRYKSAEFISYLVRNLTMYESEEDILVLTPFRAQRTLIRSFLRSEGKKKVAVSTVHKAQGSERHTVIFDPVMGASPFLQTEDAERLINVALSRAKARLIVILSEGDRKNPMLYRIACVIQGSSHFTGAIPIGKLAANPRFPQCAVDKTVQIKETIGRIVNYDSAHFFLLDFASGKTRKYRTDMVRKNFAL